MRTIGLLGGSFNPIHIGHLRLATEIMETLQPHRLDLIPCAQPPHKNAKGFLPFELRCNLVEMALNELCDTDTICKKHEFYVNRLEGERQGPSYTWDTLVQYGENEANARLFFVLGGEDFSRLVTWYRGQEIPYLTDIIVVPRDSASHKDFVKTIQNDWPEAKADTKEKNGYVWALPNGKKFVYQPLPRLDISASLLREKWISKRNTSFLLPKSVLESLREHELIVQESWLPRS